MVTPISNIKAVINEERKLAERFKYMTQTHKPPENKMPQKQIIAEFERRIEEYADCRDELSIKTLSEELYNMAWLDGSR